MSRTEPTPPQHPLHVIAGAGQIGPMVAARLISRGYRVRMIRRGAFADAPPGAETVNAERQRSRRRHRGDARRLGRLPLREPALPSVARGADPARARHHAGRGGRTARAWSSSTTSTCTAHRPTAASPRTPRSRRSPGRARCAPRPPRTCSTRTPAATSPWRSHARPTSSARAAPGRCSAIRFWKKLFAGRPVEVMGDPDQPHTYSYGPDVADALVTLGAHRSDAIERCRRLRPRLARARVARRIRRAPGSSASPRRSASSLASRGCRRWCSASQACSCPRPASCRR